MSQFFTLDSNHTKFDIELKFKGRKSDGEPNDSTQTLNQHFESYALNGHAAKLKSAGANLDISSTMSKNTRVSLITSKSSSDLVSADGILNNEIFNVTYSKSGYTDGLTLSFSEEKNVSAIYYKNEDSWVKVADGNSLKLTELGKYAVMLSSNKGPTVASKFSLEQNYPNPFNPTTTIRYTLSKNTNVQLIIFNSLGQKVRTAVSSFQTVGPQKYVWDGTNNLGNKVASGIYFYKLITPNRVLSKKMVLIK
jgi:hypothetical protein